MKTALLIALGLTLSSVTSALEIHVAVDGKISNSGAADAPLPTISAARDVVRASGKLGVEHCSVIIGAGIYRIEEPIRFGPEDGGSKNHPVIYRAAEGEAVVFTGAQEVKSSWKPWRDGIYRTQVGAIDAIDQLFVNGKRQILARYPDQGAGFIPVGKDKTTRGKKAGNVPYDGSTPDAWDASRAKKWTDPTGAFMHGMHSGLWGSQHYRVLGKKADGSLHYEGGWQNNRHSQPHKGYRMIENVFEELDAAGEWFHDTKKGWLYYKPANGIDMASAKVEAVLQIKHLVEFYGTHKEPVAEMKLEETGNGLKTMMVKTYVTKKHVKHIQLQGIGFTGTARTFMETKEPLLRSDWSIYRGGAIHLRGTEGIQIKGCTFEELGGNAVFVDGYNRGAIIRGNLFRENGAGDVNLVGSPAAVCNPAFSYGSDARPVDEIDTKVGPKSDEYPADCLVEDNLMTRPGRFEKQVAGVNLSVASRITIRHNTISRTPRAAINVCNGTWGGHLIEWNDCFETVLETHDHGAYNSWGRDRIWHSASPGGPKKRDKNGKALISYYIDLYPKSPRWDAYQTTIIRHNRMHCEHGWDIDLDDGSTNYEIYNNLCLSGGLKTREGYYRIVTNNVVIGGYTCNVPYPKPTHDVFERNIVAGRKTYNASKPTLWGGTRNYTFVHNPEATKTEPAIALQKITKDDASSLYGNAQFVAPEKGNFSVKADSPALKVGFKNFPMERFGVISTSLKAQAPQPPFQMPDRYANNVYQRTPSKTIGGAKVKTLDTEAEMTATGMHDIIGAYLLDVPAASELARYGFKSGDVALMVNQKPTPSARVFGKVMSKLKPGTYRTKVWRGQESVFFNFRKLANKGKGNYD